jgi:hypothetical protein
MVNLAYLHKHFSHFICWRFPQLRKSRKFTQKVGFMYKQRSVTEYADGSGNGMEARDHCKNGASLKSQMSRGNQSGKSAYGDDSA